MAKILQAKDILARFIDARPEFESYEAFSRRIGLETTVTVVSLNKREDVNSALMFEIAKAFGYQIMFFNPDPPDGLEKCYIVGKNSEPILPREKRKRWVYHKDPYTKEVYREKRKYMKKKKEKNKDNGLKRWKVYKKVG